MKSPVSKPLIVAVSVTCLLLMAAMVPASAARVGFDLVITPRAAPFFDPDFGTGVSPGDTFVGTLFFDTVDLTPDGARKRSILPGGDALTIAGVSFDALLDDTFWFFTFAGGVPACFDNGIGGPCGTGTSQINFETTGNVALSFTDTLIGTAFDADQRSLGFNYSINIPVPAAAYLLGSGLLVLAGVGRRRRSAV